MSDIISGLRDIVGIPGFYDSVSGAVDYNLLLEYIFACLLLLTVVSCVFKLLFKLFGGSN